MARVTTLLGSKVARRMVMLFVTCALGPMSALAIVSYFRVSAQLRDASLDRRHQTSKSVGMDLMASFRRLESELALVAVTVQPAQNHRFSVPEVAKGRLEERFRGVVLARGDQIVEVLVGSVSGVAGPSANERAHLSDGKTALHIDPDGRMTMRQAVPSIGLDLVAVLSPEFLWNSGDLVPPTMELLVLGPQAQVILPPTQDDRAPLPDQLVQGARQGALGEIEWNATDEARLGTYWTVPLGFDFLLPRVTVFVSEPRSVALAPMVSGRNSLILVSAASLWGVLLLALIHVKRHLQPLDRLDAATRRIAAGDFDEPVMVTSGDEFEDLAGAFNSMTRQLKQQFRVMSARSAIDRAVLSSLDEPTILTTALERLPDLVACECACVMTFANDAGETPHAVVLMGDKRASILVDSPGPDLPREDALQFHEGSAAVAVDRSRSLPAYASPLARLRWTHGRAFPIRIKNRIAGVLTVCRTSTDITEPGMSADDDVQLQRLADQIAVALSNARLVGALDRLNVGTLQALARTVDAKSQWTAGHSQRVASMAVDLGRELAVADAMLDIINRGSLMHDIGKIAVPGSILNKPGPMTDEEYALMKEHPRTGARILEPIPEYHQLIPIVLQHHEWFDGRGYPDGLAGEAISFEARIVAVADVFDAVTSKRPYRDGLGLERSIQIIRDGSGTQFDPAVVRAFLAVIDKRSMREAQPAA